MNAADLLLGESALARRGPLPALRCGEESLDYSALAARVRAAAAAYAALGVAPGDRVLILLRDTPDHAAAWLGAVWCGAVAVSLNTKLSDAELRHIAADSAARLLVAEPATVRDLGVPAIDAGALRRGGGQVAAHAVLPEQPAFWLYSSGTTGRPKGVVHTHRAMRVAGQVQREVLGLGEGDRVLVTSKLFFAYALENGLLGPLALGATALLHPDWADVESVSALVERHAPSAMFSVPSFYRRLLALPAARLRAFGKVRRFVAAGERLPVRIVEAWRDATGTELLSAYGLSETFCVSMATRPGEPAAMHTGAPLAGVEARLADPAGAPVGDAEPGVLWVRHPALAQGYANLPERTREQFRDGWFCTNDMFVRDGAGNFTHQGRADELIKISGQWVRPNEIEEVALADPAIADAACVPVADADGFERIALFIAANGDADAALSAAGDACERQLARHQRPKWIRTVAELPRTATGKVQRFRLREMLEREFGRSV